jgi:hypothetical protein
MTSTSRFVDALIPFFLRCLQAASTVFAMNSAALVENTSMDLQRRGLSSRATQEVDWKWWSAEQIPEQVLHSQEHRKCAPARRLQRCLKSCTQEARAYMPLLVTKRPRLGSWRHLLQATVAHYGPSDMQQQHSLISPRP